MWVRVATNRIDHIIASFIACVNSISCLRENVWRKVVNFIKRAL